MKKAMMVLLTLLFLAAVALPGAAVAEVKLGVLANRGAPECMKQWGATAAYLSGKIGDKVTIVPLKFEAVEPAVAAGQVDLVLANSAFYAELEKTQGVKAVLTMANLQDGKTMTQFGGVILVKADSPIKTLADLKGKKFMVTERSSFGGGQMAWRLLLENGINPDKDCAEVMIGKKQDNVVLSVINGAADAGTVRSDVLESMAAAGTIKLADVRVLNQVKDAFPYMHSTQLYPEWPLAAAAKADPAMVQKIAGALKALKPTDEAAKAAGIAGWVDPLDYGPVRDCLKTIKYGAFADVQ
ncbi:MAG: phosphate/phosphite/phosphonate ABC transporter substrate-binding protein [bacterium]|nr:phosphate/phosphite/phosphonate ABC transporter substrate-binding protein [bacterium]